MNKKCGWLMLLVLLCLAVFAVQPAFALDSKLATGSTSAALTFGPSSGQTVVKSLYADSDKAGSVVKLYARSGNKLIPTANATNGATVIAIAGTTLTTNDVVVYAHANGVLDTTTIVTATSSNATLAAAITVAGSAGDVLYEVSQQGQISVGSNTVSTAGEAVFATPGDSPLYCVLDGTSAAKLQVTVAR